MTERVVPFGERAALVELDDLDQVHRVWRHLGPGGSSASSDWPGLEEVVPGARTVLLRFAAGIRPAIEELADRVAEIRKTSDGRAPRDGSTREIVLPVVYDGPDLDEVARLAGISAAEVVDRHQRARYTVAFLGFAPGFAYLTGGDPVLRVPRRATPRSRVAAGSVGLASDMTAVYPGASPGGWQLIGRTDAVLFDLDRDPPNLWGPGDRVRFVVTDALSDAAFAAIGAHAGDAAGSASRPLRPGRSPDAYVVRSGPLTTLQDHGRIGWAHLGVPRAGAVDREAAALANALVGNPTDGSDAPAVLESTLSGPVLRFASSAVIALAGAPTDVTLDGVSVDSWPQVVTPGTVLRVGACRSGLRTYLAVGGGWDSAPVLGSRSTDTLSGLGPDPLRDGDHLHVGSVPVAAAPTRSSISTAFRLATEFGGHTDSGAEQGAGPALLRILPGPRADWLDTDDAVAHLCDPGRTDLTVSPHSDRVGTRLAGAAVPVRRSGDLPSEGMVPGAIQLPPDGQPVVLMANHATTGGYPVVAVVVEADLHLLAQARPGQTVRFVPVEAEF